MSDRLTQLLDHTADQLADGVTAPPLLAEAPRRSSRPGWLLPLAVAAAVLAIVAAAALLRPGPSVPVEYADAVPELGTSALPVDVHGRTILEQSIRRPGRPVGPADLLAQLTNRKGTGVLVAQPMSDGRTCATFGYLPPAINMGGTVACWNPASEDPLYSQDPLTFEGMGPGGAPGGIKDPAVVYGGAPPGTRVVELSGDGRDSVRVPARDGGDRYDHRAYFAATWDLGAGPITVRALAADGQELARVERPAPQSNPAWDASRCESNRQSLRSHFSRAAMVGEKWARTHPESADARRLALPPSGPMKDETAIARFDYALTQLEVMGAEETYDYRLAANVVLGEADCFPSPAVQEAARRFKAESG